MTVALFVGMAMGVTLAALVYLSHRFVIQVRKYNRTYNRMEPGDQEKIETFIADVKREVVRARSIYPNFANYHEGYSVILEELDELWDEIKKKPSKRDKVALYKEALHTSAMALRFMVDCDVVKGLE